LRSAQRKLAEESAWMIAELQKIPEGEPEEQGRVTEARQLVAGLGQAAGEFLNLELLALKQFAVAERDDTVVVPAPRSDIKRLLNGLHATVAPIDGLIRRMGKGLADTGVSMILMNGMVIALRAIDNIDDELRPVLEGRGELPDGQDFGVYDPGQ
jgi:hypothetical protein